MLKVKEMFTDEFRKYHSMIIEEFQWLEWTLKNIYANLIDGHYPECFDEVAEKPLGKLIGKLQDIENRNHTKFLDKEDYEDLKKVRDMRNYWCHQCYIDGNSYLEQKPNLDIVKVERHQLDKIKNEYEIVRKLHGKLIDIKIPEKEGKWRLDDFIKIVGVNFIPFEE